MRLNARDLEFVVTLKFFAGEFALTLEILAVLDLTSSESVPTRCAFAAVSPARCPPAAPLLL